MNNKSLGEFIAELRKERGLTQKQFAQILNVSDKTVSHWECDETSPDISLLPLIAETFGITVDELLKREKNTPSPEGTPYKFRPFAPKSNGQLFASFKIQSIIVASISLVTLIVSVGVRKLLSYFVFADVASVFSFSIALCGALIAVVCALIFAVMLKNKLSDDENKNDILFKCLRITSLNIYLSLVCISLFMSFFGKDKYIYFLICIALLSVSELIVGRRLCVYSGKEKLYALRRNMIVLLAVLIMCGGFFQFAVLEVYHPHPKNIIFYSADKFKQYMETPKDKPPKAYLVDEAQGVTQMLVENEEDLPKEQSNIETIYDDNGKEVVSFAYLNKEVYDFTYHSEQKTFHIITYQAKIKAQNIKDFRDGTLGGVMTVYYICAFAAIVFVYRKKKSELQKLH